MIEGLLFLFILFWIGFFISLVLPVIIVKNIFKFKLTKKQHFSYGIYLLFFPFSLLFTKLYYNELKNNKVISYVKWFIKIFWTMILLSFFLTLIINKAVVNKYIAKPLQVNGQSMYPTIYDKEFIFTTKINKDYNRWDVIVFETPSSISGNKVTRNLSIKRIIGLPWDTIKIENWKVSLKVSEIFKELNENYLDEESKDYTFVNWISERVIYKVPENSYFVLWDNRNHTTDSRTCFLFCSDSGSSEFLQKNDIIWKYFFDLWYFDIKNSEFKHPILWIDTVPKFFDIN